MAEELDLIEIKDFATAGSASNNDFLPISQSGVTRKIGLDVLVSIIISLNNILKQSDIVNNLITESSTKPLSAEQGKILKDLVDLKIPISDIVNNLISSASNQPLSANQGRILKNLVDSKIDVSKIVDNLTSNSGDFVLSAKQGKILHDLIEGFASQVGSGIIGEAIPTTTPISEGFGIYTTSTVGIYSDFLDINGNPIQVFESDLIAGSGGLVQLWGNNNVWEKHVTIIDNISLPTPSNETFIIL